MHHTFHIRLGVAHLAKEVCEFLKISNALEAGRRLLLAKSAVEIAANCSVASAASEWADVVDVIDDGFEPDLGIGSFPWARNREALGILYLEPWILPTRSKCLAKRLLIRSILNYPIHLLEREKFTRRKAGPRRPCPASSAPSISNPTAPRYISSWGRHI